MENIYSEPLFSVAYYLQITKKCWFSDANMEIIVCVDVM